MKRALLVALLALSSSAHAASGVAVRSGKAPARTVPVVTPSFAKPNVNGAGATFQSWKPGMAFTQPLPTLPGSAIDASRQGRFQAVPANLPALSPSHQGLVEAMPLLEGGVYRAAPGAAEAFSAPAWRRQAETLEQKTEALREPLSTLSRAARGAASDEEVLGAGRRVEEVLLGVSRAARGEMDSNLARTSASGAGRGDYGLSVSASQGAAPRDSEAPARSLPPLPAYAGFAAADAMAQANARLGVVSSPRPAALKVSIRSVPSQRANRSGVARLMMDVVWPDALAFAQVSASPLPVRRTVTTAVIGAAARLEAPVAAPRAARLPTAEAAGDLELFAMSAALAAQHNLPSAAPRVPTVRSLSRPSPREPLAAQAFLALLFLGLAPLALRQFQP